MAGGREAAGVFEDFLKQHSRGELRVGTGYASAYGLGWLHARTRHRPVRLLVGDLHTGFDRWTDEDQKTALAFLMRDDVSVRGCHAPDGMLHSKVWIALDPETPGEPNGMLVGSANLTKNGLHKNDETVARAAPEEHRRITNELGQSMRRSWDAKAELLVRLGRDATDVAELSAATRRGGKRRGGRLRLPGGRLPWVLAGLLTTVASIVVAVWALNSLIGTLSDFTNRTSAESGASDLLAPAAVSEASAELLENTGAAASCPYALPDGSDACGLLESLGGGDSVPCESLPLAARPLRLTSAANPAGYTGAEKAPGLVCSWIDGGTFVAGETIPAGDLRAMHATVYGTGQCKFEVFDDTGAITVSRADYEAQNWTSYALLRLAPGTTITTSDCGWVPVEHAGLGPGSSGVIGPAQHTGRSYPLIVGVDVPPEPVQIECDFWVWPAAEPDEHGSWATSLPRRADERRAPDLYQIESGIIWPTC